MNLVPGRPTSMTSADFLRVLSVNTDLPMQTSVNMFCRGWNFVLVHVQRLLITWQVGDEVIIVEYKTNIDSLVECLRHVHDKWLEYEDIISIAAQRFSFQYRVGAIVQGRGRPRFDIAKEQLLLLSSLNFTWSEIASLLGFSRMTIYRLTFLLHSRT